MVSSTHVSHRAVPVGWTVCLAAGAVQLGAAGVMPILDVLRCPGVVRERGGFVEVVDLPTDDELRLVVGILTQVRATLDQRVYALNAHVGVSCMAGQLRSSTICGLYRIAGDWPAGNAGGWIKSRSPDVVDVVFGHSGMIDQERVGFAQQDGWANFLAHLRPGRIVRFALPGETR